MATQQLEQPLSCIDRFRNLSRGKKAIVVVMTIWAAQAVPKWTAAITADGELSASIMTTFVAPRGVD